MNGVRGLPSRAAPPLLLSAVFVLLLQASWLRWPDVMADYGQTPYIAWQLASGKTLGKELLVLHGPLSHYANSVLFRLFGVGIRTLVLSNTLLLALFVATLYRLLRRFAGALATTAACLVFLLLFAFSQYVSTGNYNYVCPYCPEVVHGLYLSVASLLFLARFTERRRRLDLWAAGLFLGLAFLTKAEVFLAAAIAVAFGLVRLVRSSRLSRREAFELTAAALLPPVVAFLLLATALPLAQALVSTLGPWPPILKGTTAELDYYRRGMGTLDLPASLRRLGLWTLGWGACLAALTGLDRAAGRWRVARSGESPLVRRSVTALAALVPISLFLLRGRIDWLGVLTPLPVALAAWLVWRLRRGEGAETELVFAVFSLSLLAKMALFTRLFHYGFVLAAPATLFLAVELLDRLPEEAAARGGAGWLLRGGAAALIAVVVAVYLPASGLRWKLKTCPVGQGADRFLADARGCVLESAVQSLRQTIPPGKTLVVLPEGITLNYLLRRESPDALANYMPPEMAVFGEASILASFRSKPPDFVVLARKDLSEFGFRAFGVDYAMGIAGWLRGAYEPVASFGNDPGFGLLVLRRRGSPGQ